MSGIVSADRVGRNFYQQTKLFSVFDQAVNALRKMGIETSVQDFVVGVSCYGGMTAQEARNLKDISSRLSGFKDPDVFLEPLGIEDRMLRTSMIAAAKGTITEYDMQRVISGFEFYDGSRNPRLLDPAREDALGMRTLRISTMLNREEYGDSIAETELEEIKRFARDPEKIRAFYDLLQRCQNSFERGFSQPLIGMTRLEKIAYFLNNSPNVLRLLKRINGTEYDFAVSLGTLMKLGTTSELGIYTRHRGEITPTVQNFNFEFLTLQFLSYWRNTMGLWILKLADKFKAAGQDNIDIVMVGDGAGELGAAISETLLLAQRHFRLIHLDVGLGSLQQQKETYLRYGIPEERILTIEGSVLDASRLLKERAPGFCGGIFLLHEVLDNLTSHQVYIGKAGPQELYLSLENDIDITRSKLIAGNMAAPYTSSLLESLDFFPFFRYPGVDRIFPYSIELPLAIKAIAESAPRVAAYFGDYAPHLVYHLYEDLSVSAIRFYQKGRKVGIKEFFADECDITSDVDFRMIALALAFGCNLDVLDSQENIIAKLDPRFRERIEKEIRELDKRTMRDYTPKNILEFFRHRLLLQLASPSMFGSLITKGI